MASHGFLNDAERFRIFSRQQVAPWEAAQDPSGGLRCPTGKPIGCHGPRPNEPRLAAGRPGTGSAAAEYHNGDPLGDRHVIGIAAVTDGWKHHCLAV